MSTLTLNLKAEYFNQIASGEKIEEFRLCNEFWQKRLEGRHYERIVICLGYPPKNDTSRRILKPWRGYVKKTIQHKHFGDNPVQVYAIHVGK